jgi:predicted metal-dependent peptidase
VFEYIEENDINPAGIVFLTDLYCHDFGDEPSCPVLWVTTGATDAPFGEVVPMVDK